MVPEAGAWAGFASKTPAARPIVIDFPYETPVPSQAQFSPLMNAHHYKAAYWVGQGARVVGWSLQSRQTTDVVLQALLMAVWRRKPKNKVLIHSDQGSQFTSSDWASFLRAHNLEHSMSRRGNCHGNALAESFFNLLKRERIRRRVYKTRP